MKDIIQIIERFIDHRMYNYALMINGKWGCGKTYYIQNTLIPYLKSKEYSGRNKYDVNYISLYGVCSTDEISRMLCVQALKDKMGKAGKLIDSKGGQITTLLLSTVTKSCIEKIGLEKSALEDLISIFPNYKNNIIIFDDLERCNGDISEVLGYINNFVEHSEASIILVANEEEIGNWQLERNPEMQLCVALNKRIDVDVDPTEEETVKNYFSNNKKQEHIQRESYTLDQLEQKRRAIFRGDEKYKRIKEKVIGQTINFEPDLKTLFMEITNRCIKNTAEQNLIISMLDELVKVAEQEKHANLRTFQFFLEKENIIFEAINEEYSSLHRTILLYCYRSAVRYMKGMEMPKWNGDYGDQRFGGKLLFGTTLTGFKFIDDLIVTNHFVEKDVKDVLFRFTRITEKKGQFLDDPYQKIGNWHLASDEELKSWLMEIKDNIGKGKYSTELYPGILSRVANISSYNIMTDICNDVFYTMKNYIQNTDPNTLEDIPHEHYMLNEKTAKMYKNQITEIEELIKEAKKESEKNVFEKAMKEDAWGTTLFEIVSNSDLQWHSFIYWIEPEIIANKIAKSSNKELQQFRFALQYCYESNRVSYENKDIDNLTELKRLLDAANKSEMGEIQKNYYTWIVNDISGYLERIDPYRKQN